MSFKIISAKYGHVKSGAFLDVTDLLIKKIVDSKLTVAVTNSSFGKDPAQFLKKALKVEYEYEGEKIKKTFREGVVAELPMPQKIAKQHRYSLNLPEVTVATACWENESFLSSAVWAYKQFNKKTAFGEKIFFISDKLDSSEYNEFFEKENIKKISLPEKYNLKKYSHFVVKEIHEYVNKDFLLMFQSDGFIDNIDNWTDEYLDYDYIGAPWWYKDHNNVGNGGFSLRSKKLLEALANDDRIVDVVPEDHHICRTYGDYLREEHGIKFASNELASKFSAETGSYVDQFGFHGAWQLESYLNRLRRLSS